MLKWSDFEAAIPAVVSIPERAASVVELICALRDQCCIQATVKEQWNPRPGTSDGYLAIAELLRTVSKSPWLIYLEDDAQLSSEFGSRVLPVVSRLAEDVASVAFFSPRLDDPQRLAAGDTLYDSGFPFYYLQCNVIRGDVILPFAEELEAWASRNAPLSAPDVVLGHVCLRRKQRIQISLPSLVQHRPIPSAFGHPVGLYTSRTFVP